MGHFLKNQGLGLLNKFYYFVLIFCHKSVHLQIEFTINVPGGQPGLIKNFLYSAYRVSYNKICLKISNFRNTRRHLIVTKWAWCL